jgi:membrane protease subunit (stomatin/prohibitin family)
MFARRRPLLRAAVVGGGAYAAGRHMGRQAEQRDYAEADQDQRISDVEQQQYASQPQQQYAPPPQQAPAAPSMYDQLQQLSTLHEQGALTDEEFAAAKAKVLGS